MNKTPQGLFTGPNRPLTLGIILSTTMIAFEGLALTTVAPAIVQDIGGFAWYGWIFTGYLLAQLVGSVAAGQAVDRRGLGAPVAVALLIFAVGLLLAAVASTMPLLVFGRVLQGLGAGGLGACTYSSITLGYPDNLRPRILAVLSSAYIVPALIGPYLAGLLTEELTWRAVFWSLLPLVFVAGGLVLPAYRRLTPQTILLKEDRVWLSLLLAAGAALLLVGLGALPQPVGLLMAVLGGGLALVPLRRLLPPGTLTAGPGLPATLAARGLFSTGFFAVQTYLVLALTELAGYTERSAGLIVTVSALSWTASAWLQAWADARDSGKGRLMRVHTGLFLMVIGITLTQGVVWLEPVALPLALIGQIVAGLGIGLAHPASGTMVFAQAVPGDEGNATASLLLADQFVPAVGIGLGGAILASAQATGWGIQTSIAAALGICLGVTLLAVAASFRLSPQPEPAE